MMRQRTLVVCLFICGFFCLGIGSLSYADDAVVLPKGRFRVHADTRFYLPIDRRFNPDGDAEDLAVDYNNTSLDSRVFSGLAALEDPIRLGPLALPPGTASIGNSLVSFEYDLILSYFSVQYGVTDRLTVGVRLPYWWMKNRVSARVDSTTATVGKNRTTGTLFRLPARGVEGPVPGIPGRTEFLTTEDIQQILGSGLDINGDGRVDVPGFGFKRVETWSDDGIGDLEAGFRYQYLKTKDWRLAFTGGARFPTGRVDDPDNLVDYPFGSGAYALLFRVNNDYTGIKNLVLNGTFRYDLILPDKQTKRVPSDVNRPITANKEEVDRDLGDTFEFEVSGAYTLLKGLSVSGLYQYAFALQDRVSGKLGFAYSSLENETDWTSHIFQTGVSYTTLPLYVEKKFPVPLAVSVSYRNRFAGTNNALKSQFISLEVSGFF